MALQRYDAGYCPDMDEGDGDGDWVKYDDVKADIRKAELYDLLAECQHDPPCCNCTACEIGTLRHALDSQAAEYRLVYTLKAPGVPCEHILPATTEALARFIYDNLGAARDFINARVESRTLATWVTIPGALSAPRGE